MSEYTASDFVNAKFADHPDDGKVRLLKVRADGTWLAENGRSFTDRDMAEGGWIPVPSAQTTQTITQSDLDLVEARWRTDMSYKFADMAHDLGLNVVPDHEPTNAKKWDALVSSYADSNTNLTFGGWMDANGIQAPGDKP